MSAIDNLARITARDLILQHLHSFPDDMQAEQRALQKRLGVTDSIVFASFRTLEFEIVQAIKEVVEAEREACAELCEAEGSVAGADVIAKAIRSRS